jgi:hypothetical protein
MALTLGSAFAGTVSSFTVTREQEQRIAIGMTAREVQRIVGSTGLVEKFADRSGPIWIFKVPGVGNITPRVLFYVEFGPDGRVARAHEVEVDARNGT